MKPGPVINFIGVLLVFLGAFMLLPIAWAIYFGEALYGDFLLCAAFTSGLGFLLWKSGDPSPGVQVREGFAIVAFGWMAAVVCGALPYLITGAIPSITDAVFESTSGFTTTGASILSDVEILPKSVLFWRSFTHWLGGMGIIVFSIAILPVLGIGGMQLYRAEAPGPTLDKLTPRIRQTAKLLWGIYTIITVVETALLMLFGMTFFDAICHAFGTVATGGFSTRNASIAAFGNPWIHWTIIVFMFVAATNFALHYRALLGRPLNYLRDAEFRFFAGAILTGILVVIVTSWLRFRASGTSIRDVVFVVVSQGTCTGFTTVDYQSWHPEAVLTLIVLMFMGGMVGSTAGGLKSMRCWLILKRIRIEIKKLIHPDAVLPVRFGSRIIPAEATSNVMAFALLFIILFLIISMILIALGLDDSTAFGATIACMSGVGPGIGLVGPMNDYSTLPLAAKWVLIAAMILGRLELMTVLVLFSRSFWKR